MLLLEVKALSCSLPSPGNSLFNRRRKQILRDVNLLIREGSTLGLLGRSGSGKTTLAKCVAGLLEPDGGSVTYRGVNIFPQTGNRNRFPLEIQIVFQAGSATFNPKRKLGKSIAEAIEARGEKKPNESQEAMTESLVSAVGLNKDVLDRYPRQLSGGERQRASIARTLAVLPALLILDEPTSALDVLTQVQILELLRFLQAERRFSVLYMSHDIPTAFRFCDRVAFLHDGTIVEEGSCSEILEHPRHQYTRQVLTDCRMITL